MEELYNDIPEEENETVDYPASDMLPPVVSDKGKFPVTETLASIATGTPESEESVDRGKLIDDSYTTVVAKNNQRDLELIEEFSKIGHVPAVLTATQDIQRRVDLHAIRSNENAAASFEKLKEVAEAAAEHIATTTVSIVINNPPEKINQAIDSSSKAYAAMASLEKEIVDGSKGWVGGIAYELTTMAAFQGMHLDDIAVKHGAMDASQKSFTRGNSHTVEALRNKYKSLRSVEEKHEWLSKVYEDLKSISTSDWKAALRVLDIVGTEDIEKDGVDDWLDRLGLIGTVLGGVGALLKSGKAVKSANQLRNLEKIVAAQGGKAGIEAADTAKLLRKAANAQYASAAKTIVAEGTGASAVLDLAKFTSAAASKVLPDAITTSSKTLQTHIINSVEDVLYQLKNTVGVKGIKGEEAEEAIAEITARYSSAVDKTIHSASPFKLSEDGLRIVGKVRYAPAGESSFTTLDAAKAFMEAKGNPKSMRIVSDGANTNFAVEEDVVKELSTRRDVLKAKLVEQGLAASAAKKGSKRASKAKTEAGEGVGSLDGVKAPVAPPKSLSTSKPGYSVGTFKITGKDLGWESQLDKAIYQLTNVDKASGTISMSGKSDPEVLAWVKSQGLTEEQILSAGKGIRDHLKKAITNVDVVESGKYKVPKQTTTDTVPAPKARAGATDATETDGVVLLPHQVDGAFDSAKVSTVAGNLKVSDNVHSTVIAMVTRLGHSLGMDNHPMLVADLSTLKASKDKNLKHLHKYVTTNYPGAGAVHIPTNRGSIIVMREAATLGDLHKYMSTFAHEYAHAFEWVFTAKYDGIMQSNFKKWLHSKGIKFEGSGESFKVLDQMPIGAIMEYRNVDTFDGYTSYVHKWFNNDKDAWLKAEPYMRSWAQKYGEFFAENFSKWALTDEVPTTILGQTFKHITNKVKEIFRMVEDMFFRKSGEKETIRVGADKNTASMMNAHIKNLTEQEPRKHNIKDKLVQETKAVPEDVSALQAELDLVEEQLRAYKTEADALVGGFFVEEDVSKLLTYKHLKNITKDDITSASRIAALVGDGALSGSSQIYGERLVGVHQQSRYQKILTEFVRPSVEKLSTKEFADLNAALVLGDKEGKVFSEVELAGLDLSPRARLAYYDVRSLRDVMYMMRNDTAIKSLSRNGYSKLVSEHVVPEAGAGDFFIRPIEPNNGSEFYNTVTKQVEKVDKDVLSSAGIRMYELDSPRIIDGKSRKRIGIKEGEHELATIDTVIPYRAGEYRRIYTDEYFVKLDGLEDVDGVSTTVSKAHRTAKTAKDAERYVSAFNEAVALNKAGKLDTAAAARLLQPYNLSVDDFRALVGDKEVKAHYVYNRTEDDFVTNSISVNNTWASKRGEHLPDVFGETSSNTLSPLDSLASEIGNTAYVASVAEWRESNIIRWFNTFQDVLPKHMQNMEPADAFVAMGKEGDFVGQDKSGQVARQVYDYIVSQLNITTPEERAHVGIMRSMSEWLEGTKIGDNKAMHKVGVLMRQSSNYPQWLRTVAFHAYFSLNPAQVFVQGMNAFNAVAISPIHGMKAALSSPLYRMALMSDNESIWRNFAKTHKIASIGIGDEDEFVETVRAIRRSGLLDGIGSSSMYNAESGRYGLFNGLSRRAGAISAAPFNEGEAYSRLVSFDIAKREFIKSNPGVAWWTDDNLAKIMQRQDDLTQNMTTANTASWQKGWKSIPTQFIQYQVKLMMNIMHGIAGNSRAVTRGEAIQLMLVHGAVMGTAGYMLWPARGFIGNAVNESDLTEEQKLYIQQGMIAGFIGSVTDGEVRLGIGSRFNTFRWFEDLFDAISDPEKPFVQVMAGASGAAVANIFAGGANAWSILHGNPLTPSTFKLAAEELATTSVSSISNIHKARLALNNYNVVTNKNSGKEMFRVTSLEAYLMGIGIPPAKAEDFEIAYRSKRDHKKEMMDAAKEVAKRRELATIALRKNDMDSYQKHQAVIDYIRHGYINNPSDWNTIHKESLKVQTSTQYHDMIKESLLKGRKLNDVVVNTNPAKE